MGMYIICTSYVHHLHIIYTPSIHHLYIICPSDVWHQDSAVPLLRLFFQSDHEKKINEYGGEKNYEFRVFFAPALRRRFSTHARVDRMFGGRIVGDFVCVRFSLFVFCSFAIKIYIYISLWMKKDISRRCIVNYLGSRFQITRNKKKNTRSWYGKQRPRTQSRVNGRIQGYYPM